MFLVPGPLYLLRVSRVFGGGIFFITHGLSFSSRLQYGLTGRRLTTLMFSVSTHWLSGRKQEASGPRCARTYLVYDDVMTWIRFPRYWPFVRRIHRSRWIVIKYGNVTNYYAWGNGIYLFSYRFVSESSVFHHEIDTLSPSQVLWGDSQHKRPMMQSLLASLLLFWISFWTNSRVVGEKKRLNQRSCDVIRMLRYTFYKSHWDITLDGSKWPLHAHAGILKYECYLYLSPSWLAYKTSTNICLLWIMDGRYSCLYLWLAHYITECELSTWGVCQTIEIGLFFFRRKKPSRQCFGRWWSSFARIFIQ